jgi:hypothetical protein
MATLVNMSTVPAADPSEMTAPNTLLGMRLGRRILGVLADSSMAVGGPTRFDGVLERSHCRVSTPVIPTDGVDLLPLADWEADGGRVFTSPTAFSPA